MSREPVFVSSRDNPLLARVRKLAHEPGGYRKTGEVWLEGDHLLRAAVARGRRFAQLVVTESGWAHGELRALGAAAERVTVIADALMKGLSTLESPAPVAALMALDAAGTELRPGIDSVVLDRLQDAGNVGSILRSAAALGVTQVVALKGTAALWSPKVLRAGMGAHFALRLVEGSTPEQLDALALPLLATSSHASRSIADSPLPAPCAWLLGHEGQGIAPELLARCAETRRIPQPGGEESLNVAAAAAICLYEAARQRAAAD